MAENIVRTLKVRPFTTKVIKSHVKLHMKSNATKIPREFTPYITLFTARSRIFLPAAILRVALSWPPRKPTVFVRLPRWQQRDEELQRTISIENKHTLYCFKNCGLLHLSTQTFPKKIIVNHLINGENRRKSKRLPAQR